MIKTRSPYLYRRGLQNKMEAEFMSIPNASLSTNYYPELQTRNYHPIIDTDEIVANPFSVVDIDFSWLTEAEEQLREVYQEVMEACALDNEIDPVPDSAYNDAFQLLQLLDDHNIPMPDIGWLMDGGIGFEWRSTNVRGIGTMSIYGDNKVIYGASLGNGHRDKGICDFTDLVEFVRFLPMLKDVCSQ